MTIGANSIVMFANITNLLESICTHKHPHMMIVKCIGILPGHFYIESKILACGLTIPVTMQKH